MAINRTIDFLPEYFRSIPNQRFLNSTLDRLISDPVLRNFDGYVGRKRINGSKLTGSYVTESTEFRENYQLEPEFVFRAPGEAVKSQGFKDVLNAVASKSGLTNQWNRLLTDNTYSYMGFADLDKLSNYQNYVWLPDPRIVNNTLVDENKWFRTPVEVTNSVVPTSGEFRVSRTNTGLQIENKLGANPELYLARGGNYTFNIDPPTTVSKVRAAKLIEQISTTTPVIADSSNKVFGGSSAAFLGNSGLKITNTDDFDLNYTAFTLETWVLVRSDYEHSDQLIIGQWNPQDTTNSSWALMRTSVINTLKFSWVDSQTREIQNVSIPAPYVQTGVWNHVAVTRSASELKIYLNGELTVTTSINTISRSDQPLTIGNDATLQMGFRGNLDDLRVTTQQALYTGLNFELPTQPQSNTISTVLLAHFDSSDTVFVDDAQLGASRMWIQTDPGVIGNIPSNPSLTARDIFGVRNNGTTSGEIVFTVPDLASEDYFRNLNTTGTPFFDFVDLGTELNFDQINNSFYDKFVQTPDPGTDSNITGQRGGIDGVRDLNNKTVIFVANQDQGWTRREPFNANPWEIPSYEQTQPIPELQQFGIWQIRIIDGIIKLSFVAAVNKDFKVTVKTGVKYRNTTWYKTTDTQAFFRMPVLSSNYSTLYLQDEQTPQNVLPLRIINTPTPTLNVEKEILGKPYYTSASGVEFINGLKIKFAGDCEPSFYRELIISSKTRLIADIDSAQTEFYVQDASDIIERDQLLLDTEKMLVLSVDYDTTVAAYKVQVERGYLSTAQTTHLTTTVVKVYTTPSFIVEGVGSSISLTPWSELTSNDVYLDNNQPPDYITVNRASRDRNSWSRTNRWFNYNVVEKTLEYLTRQGVAVTPPASVVRAVRPIIEFSSGLKLWDFGTQLLKCVDVVDNTVVDALSNIYGRSILDSAAITVSGHLLIDGDLVVFNNDKNPDVRNKVYEVQYVDPDGDLRRFSKPAVKAATISNINVAALITVIDDTSITVGDRLLVKNQLNAVENGIYEVTGTGFLSRTSDANESQDFNTGFYVFVNSGTQNGNKWFEYDLLNPAVTPQLGTDPIIFTDTQLTGVKLNLKEVAQADINNTIVVKTTDVKTLDRGTQWTWNAKSAYWQKSSQQKTSQQQQPKFDIFDYNNHSFGDTEYYLDSTFTGSTLMEYQRSSTAKIDPVLQFGLTTSGTIGDIKFSNTYETDEFYYQTSELSDQRTQVKISKGLALRVDAVSGQSSLYDPWSLALTNLELYQNVVRTGERSFVLDTKLLNKTLSNQHQLYVDQVQVHKDHFAVTQQGENQVLVFIDDTVTVRSDSEVYLKIISATPIEGAWYDVPTQWEFNPFNSRPETFTQSDIRQHADALHIQHGHNTGSSDLQNSLSDDIHRGKPGIIVLHESFSALPALMLTLTDFDIDQAVKTAAQQYETFKLKFIETSEQIEGIETLDIKQAVDAVFTLLNKNVTSKTAWYYSDMIPTSGETTEYVIEDLGQDIFNINGEIKNQASNQAVGVYLNKSHLVRGVDYELLYDINAVKILRPLSADDKLTIVYYANTDGNCVPATPAKLGLGALFVPEIFLDKTYQVPQRVIQGHDGSITTAWGDYRDQLLLEFELRIYNNVKVDSETWNQIIQNRVASGGRFRDLNQTSLYSQTETNNILRRFFYEWAAFNRVDYRTSFYDPNNAFTYNYSACEDTLTSELLSGYWRGIYKNLYDTDRPHTHPWEMFGFTVKPQNWEQTFGPAPYTGANSILWNAVRQGINPLTGETVIFGARQCQEVNGRLTGDFTVADAIPVDVSGNLKSPNDFLAATLPSQSLKNPFVFADQGPVETVWRRSSTWAFAQVRAQILMNPQFMCGMLWDLDSYKPQIQTNSFEIAGNYKNWKYQGTAIPSWTDVKLHSVDTQDDTVVRRHSILNYVIELLRNQGQDPQKLRTYLDNCDLNLVYNLAGFADKDNLAVYAEQNSPNSVAQGIKIPQEDYQLVLSNNSPAGVVAYSGLIIFRTENGYKITGYDQQYPFFVINPVKTTGKRSQITVGSQTYEVYQEFFDEPVYIPYNWEFTTRQAVVDFLTGYGEHLSRQGFVFDSDQTNERVTWSDAAVQFVKWSYYRWSIAQNQNQFSLVLNPSAGVLKYKPQLGTLENLLAPSVSIQNENQQRIINKYLDVFRDVDTVYINNQQPESVIASLRAKVVNFEHKLIFNNKTVFNDLIFNSILGNRLSRVRLAGLKSGDWNGTLNSSGFLLSLSEVPDWQPNTDYLRGSIVRYKNQNYVALEKITGSVNFQYTKFSLSDQQYQNQLLPSIGAKALDLEHAYDLPYHNSIQDFVRLRCNSLGYVERPWLNNLGLDLINQTEFYRGWIKQKGTLAAVKNFTNASSDELLADFTIQEEYAFKLAQYGATGRTGFVEVPLINTVDSAETVAVEFAPGVNTSQVIKINNAQIYKKSLDWTPNFIQSLGSGELKDEETAFQDAGPVLLSEITNKARSQSLEYSQDQENALTFFNKLQMTQSLDQINIIKNVREQNWFWIVNDEFQSQDQKYNVITWQNSQAKILKVMLLPETSEIEFHLDASVDVLTGDIIAIDHQDAALTLQGVFQVTANQDLLLNDYHTALKIKIADPAAYGFGVVTYTPETQLQSFYTYVSLRHSDLGSAKLNQSLSLLGTPQITKAYVDQSHAGWSVYDYVEPWNTGVAVLPNTINPLDQSLDTFVTSSMSEDTNLGILWMGQPSFNSDQGRVIIRDFRSAVLSANVTTGLNTVAARYETGARAPFTGVRTDTLQLGKQLIGLSQGHVATTATDANNRGQLYILKYAPDGAEVSQIFRADSFNAATANVYYGSSVAASNQGEWLAVGATLPAGDGKVLLYRKFTAPAQALQTIAGSASLTYTLNFTPQSTRSLRVLVDNQTQIPDVDFSTAGNILTFVNSVNNTTILVKQLTEYWDFVQTITDPDGGNDSGAEFGSSVSLSPDAEFLVVGAPKRGTGKVYVFARDVQKFITSSTTSLLTLGSSVSSFGKIALQVNNQLLPESAYVASAGNSQVSTVNSISANSLITVDLLNFNLTQTVSGTALDLNYGGQVAATTNFIAVAAPQSFVNIGNQLTLNQGRVSLLALDTNYQSQKTIDIATLTPNVNNSLRINNWLINVGANISTMTTAINAVSDFTGITASANVTALTVSTVAEKQSTGVFNVSNVATTVSNINSVWTEIQSLENTQSLASDWGTKLNWITPTTLGILTNRRDYIDADQLTLDGDTTFDTQQTRIYNTDLTQGQRLQLYQLMQTSRTTLNTASNTTQLTPVKTIQIENQTGEVDTAFTGNIFRLWISNALATSSIAEPPVVYTNDNQIPGWVLNRQQTAEPDAHSIFRAWIYNVNTKQKTVDLDVVDLAQGLLPGAIANKLDYVTALDPASYGIQIWRRGKTYLPGDRVLYDGRVWTALTQNSALFFNSTDWIQNTTQAQFDNSSRESWKDQKVGELWFDTAQLRVNNYHQGSLTDRVQYYNTWALDQSVRIKQWIKSSVPPAQYQGTGFIDNIDLYVYDEVTGSWYFWVTNSQEISSKHNTSASDLVFSITNIRQNTLPAISPGEFNSVILYNVKPLIDSADQILHIDYVTQDHNNRLHSEYLLLSEDASGNWLKTPIYTKFVDSLCGQDAQGNQVPDTTPPLEDRYGVAFRPRQSMFRDQATALRVYFEKINELLKNRVIYNTEALEYLKTQQAQPQPNEYDLVVPDRETLLVLDVTEYASGTRVLVQSDEKALDSGWSLQELNNAKWVQITSQFFNLNVFWKYLDWSKDSVIPTPTHVIPHWGYRDSLTTQTGDYVKIIDHGNNKWAIYEILESGEWDLVALQDGTIEFLPRLWNFEQMGYGWDAGNWDSKYGWDGYPSLPIRLITQALNQYILIGDLFSVADSAFFTVLRYILQENLNIDWLMRTSFITVNHKVKNLNRKTNYRKDNEEFVKEFVEETKPFHTRIREYVNEYQTTSNAATHITDFDLPSLYDKVWFESQFYRTTPQATSTSARSYRGTRQQITGTTSLTYALNFTPRRYPIIDVVINGFSLQPMLDYFIEGNQLYLTPTQITVASVVTGGMNYALGDKLIFTTGFSEPAVLIVNSVGVNNQLQDVGILNQGVRTAPWSTSPVAADQTLDSNNNPSAGSGATFAFGLSGSIITIKENQRYQEITGNTNYQYVLNWNPDVSDSVSVTVNNQTQKSFKDYVIQDNTLIFLNSVNGALITITEDTTQCGTAEKDSLLYVSSTGIPNHSQGLWPNTIKTAATPQNWTFALTTQPQQATKVYNLPADAVIGLARNGVPIYSVNSPQTDTLNWVQDLSVSEIYTINIAQSLAYLGPDAANGWLTTNDAYVYRTDPKLLYNKGISNYQSTHTYQRGDIVKYQNAYYRALRDIPLEIALANTAYWQPTTLDASYHSPILGYALDGNPIYGPWGWKNSDGTGGIVQQTSSYRLKTTPRLSRLYQNTDSLGVVSATSAAEYALPNGEYIEDFEYLLGLGTLDQYNGRWTTTPEYPTGVYAYFVTVNPQNFEEPVYPYIVGPKFYGVPIGAKQVYQGENLVTVFVNGNYEMPEIKSVTNTVWSLRSPSGTFANDLTRWQTTDYSDWYNNRGYELDAVILADGGSGYTSDPSVEILGGGGENAEIRITRNPATQSISSVTVINKGTGFTSQPQIALTGGWDYQDWNFTGSYTANTVVQNNNDFYISTVTVPSNTAISNTACWTPLSVNDSAYPRTAILVPVLKNTTVRKAEMTLRFDRVTPRITTHDSTQEYQGVNFAVNGELFDSFVGNTNLIYTLNSLPELLHTMAITVTLNNVESLLHCGIDYDLQGNSLIFKNSVNAAVINIYENVLGDIVWDSVTQKFYKAQPSTTQTTVPAGILVTNLSWWTPLTSQFVTTTNAANRIWASYIPNTNQTPRDLTQLLSGSEYAGVVINGGNTQGYAKPSGQLSDSEDYEIGKTALHLQFDNQHVEKNIFTTRQIKAGDRSGNVAALFRGSLQAGWDATGISWDINPWDETKFNSRYFQIDQESSTDVANIVLGVKPFVWEFYFRLRTQNADQVLMDTRSSENISDGFMLYVNTLNQICLTHTTIGSSVIAAGEVTTNLWNHIAVERNDRTLTVYLNGVVLGQYIEPTSPRNYTSSWLTVGASVTGQYAANAYVDELRLTLNALRYNGAPYEVIQTAWGRNLATDSLWNYVNFIYGFEYATNTLTEFQNEKGNNIFFVGIGAATVCRDLSTHNEVVVITNPETTTLSTLTTNTSLEEISAIYLQNQRSVPVLTTGNLAPLGSTDIQYFFNTGNVSVVGNIDTANSKILYNNHGLYSGFEVIYTGGVNDVGLTAGESYFVKRIDANSFSLCESLTQLTSGNTATITAYSGAQTSETQSIILKDNLYNEIQSNASLNYNLGLGDFTIEFWIQPPLVTKTVTANATNSTTVSVNSLTGLAPGMVALGGNFDRPSFNSDTVFATTPTVITDLDFTQNTVTLSNSVTVVTDTEIKFSLAETTQSLVTLGESSAKSDFTLKISLEYQSVYTDTMEITYPRGQRRIVVDITHTAGENTKLTGLWHSYTQENFWISLERNQQDLLLFVNGVLENYLYRATQNFGKPNTPMTIKISDTNQGFVGKLADFRLTKGVSRHVPLQDFDTTLTGELLDTALGIRALDVVVDGREFFDAVNSRATEELIDGKISDVLDLRMFNGNPDLNPVETTLYGVRIFKDPLENYNYYSIPATATTTLTANVYPNSTSISLTDVTGLARPSAPANRPGVIIVNGERIVYWNLDITNKTLTNLVRGTWGTAIASVHVANSRVEGASYTETIKDPITISKQFRVITANQSSNTMEIEYSALAEVGDRINFKNNPIGVEVLAITPSYYRSTQTGLYRKTLILTLDGVVPETLAMGSLISMGVTITHQPQTSSQANWKFAHTQVWDLNTSSEFTDFVIAKLALPPQ